MASQRTGHQTIGFDVAGRCAGWVSVTEKRFAGGAAVNGTADDTAAIQAALDYAASGQRRVRLGAGAHRITAPLDVPLGVTIEAGGPSYGAVLLCDGCAAFRLLGSEIDGGWTFRQFFRNFTIRHTGTAPATGSLVEVNSGYNVEFHDILVVDVPSSTTAFDLTTVNDAILANVVIRGASGGATNYGVRVHGESTVKLIAPDFEALYIAAQNNDSGVLDVISPYMERNTVGVDNSAGSTGQVNIFGGYIVASNDSGWPVRSFASGSITNVWGTRLHNALGTQTFYRAATADGLFYDYALRRLQLGSPAAAGQAAPACALTLNEGAQQGAQYGLGLGQFQVHIGGASTFADDLNVMWSGTGNKTARFFGSGSTTMDVYADGKVQGVFALGVGSGSIVIRSGTGSPETVVAAPVGSLFLRSDGGAVTTLYVKESGTGNTGWVAK
jgi:hypothetical protein